MKGQPRAMKTAITVARVKSNLAVRHEREGRGMTGILSE
jgi:hypothetical protein